MIDVLGLDRGHLTALHDADAGLPGLAALARPVPVLAADTTMEQVDRVFARHPEVPCVAVAHPTVPALRGLLERTRFDALMSGPFGYGRSLHARRELLDTAQWDALLLTPGTGVVEAASRAITRSPGFVHDPVLVATESGTAAVAMPALLAALARALAERALTDPLTGLANRAAFFGRVEESCRRSATQPGHQSAVVFFDLDGFKAVNDTWGHETGDELLVAVAAELRRVARPTDLAARLGGDEFAVCLDIDGGGTATGTAAAIAGRLHAAVSRVGRATPGGVRASAGVAVCAPGAAIDAGDLVRAADLAMYTTKRAGGDAASEPVLVHAAADVDPLQNSTIGAAAAAGELVLDYQPIVEMTTGRVVSLEALVRWRHPRLGLLAPGAFLPAVDRRGQLPDLDDWVLRTACREFATWSTDGPFLNVNVSPATLLAPGFLDQVLAAAGAGGLPPERLRIEVPEHLLVDQLDAVADTLSALRRAGVALTLDDVGAGDTSLRHLRDVDTDGIKIDRSYVAGAVDDVKDRALVQLLVAFADRTGLAVTAEGVETVEQRDLLTSMGCRYGQGWLFGRPGPLPAPSPRPTRD
ncbi:bifunctional diguanylate cyclase/phosphodiesterase [Modestobacter sp. Leaf380]|uniref:putative bifunctional diguanylate cyclase/phosphodiesterase n=1 Tax=Modestobacter sp. Leaf380 TaxID=1736356 RepID=UPI0012F93011|nr:EAL domain-containing protein [Modestobacter sp. Leaf380]